MAGATRGAEDIERLILAAATGVRRLTADELQAVLGHIARAGFDPNARERVRGRLDGFVWRGQQLRGRDVLPPAELKYIWHVLARREWPDATTLDGYTRSIRDVILDARSGVFTSRFQGAWQLGIVRLTGSWRGVKGYAWLLIEYRIETGHWTTAYQLEHGLDELRWQQRSELRWLRRPRRLMM